MTENRPSISDAEWRVMHEIWQSEPITSGEVTSRLSETTSWTPGTIKTLLHRLVQKGVLDFQRKGNRYLYRSLFTESECIDNASDQLLHTVFHGRPVPMLAYLVESARLSGSEVETLRQMLDDIQQELPSCRSKIVVDEFLANRSGGFQPPLVESDGAEIGGKITTTIAQTTHLL